MKRIKVPYWVSEQTISLPADKVGEIVYPNNVEIRPEGDLLYESINNPVDSPSFKDFLKGDDRLLIIINDATRPTPTARILDLLWKDIKKKKDYKILVATGVHRAPSEDEYLEILGSKYYDIKDKVFSHNARDENSNVFIGKTKAGTDIYFDKLVIESKKIMFITSVEPHYFAGYTGGAKSFLPGVAGFKTIEQNHKKALEIEAKALKTEGNPVREDIEEAFKLIAKDKEIFSIQTVLNKDHKVYYCVCGDTYKAFLLACNKAKDVFSVEIKKKADIVVAVAPYPMDIDLYQSQKAIDNAKLALNKNGILILVSSCRKGVGEQTFMNLLSSCDTADAVLKQISKGYKLGYHKSAKMAEIMKWASLWAYTNLPTDILEKIFIHGFTSLEEAIGSALKEKKNSKIMFLMDASLSVPRISSRLSHKRTYVSRGRTGKKDKPKLDTDGFFNR